MRTRSSKKQESRPTLQQCSQDTSGFSFSQCNALPETLSVLVKFILSMTTHGFRAAIRFYNASLVCNSQTLRRVLGADIDMSSILRSVGHQNL
eukprot:1148531-Pelagomonas_calceolata.AAC.1